MGGWIHLYAITTILLVGVDTFRNLANFLDHSKATNDVKVHWLRLQTHMTWFPHPLHTYTRCLRIFICCGWANGSTIMPLPPYLLKQTIEILQIFWITDHSKATNDVKVHWLRLQTHMIWFSHPLHTYRRCLIPFICCGWADGSTFAPLPPYFLLAQNSQNWQISLITPARLRMMSRCIG